MAVDRATQRIFRQRANVRCEYCGFRQEDQPLLNFHVEHIIARQHGGSDHESNLCLACHWCNLHKGPNLTTLVEGELVVLFHPRMQQWASHFTIHGDKIIGLTPNENGTVTLLNMNDEERYELRQAASGSRSRESRRDVVDQAIAEPLNVRFCTIKSTECKLVAAPFQSSKTIWSDCQ